MSIAEAEPPIILVDDDPLFRETLSVNLEEAGLVVRALDGGQAALDYFAGRAPAAAILLDWNMPGIDGIEVLRRLRADGNRIPILILTGLTQPIYEERALAEGAIDFVEKSRSFNIILHRLRLVMDGTKGRPSPQPAATDDSLRLGDLELRHDSARAFWRGTQVGLTLSEFNVVRAMAQRAGRDFSYRELYDLVRGEGFLAGSGDQGFRANVRALVKRVRQKFRDIDPDFAELDNYPGFGYRWRDDGSR